MCDQVNYSVHFCNYWHHKMTQPTLRLVYGKIYEQCLDLNINSPIFVSAVHILGIQQNLQMKGHLNQIMAQKN